MGTDNGASWCFDGRTQKRIGNRAIGRQIEEFGSSCEVANQPVRNYVKTHNLRKATLSRPAHRDDGAHTSYKHERFRPI